MHSNLPQREITVRYGCQSLNLLLFITLSGFLFFFLFIYLVSSSDPSFFSSSTSFCQVFSNVLLPFFSYISSSVLLCLVTLLFFSLSVPAFSLYLNFNFFSSSPHSTMFLHCSSLSLYLIISAVIFLLSPFPFLFFCHTTVETRKCVCACK